MSIFATKTEEPATTGSDVLRATLRSWSAHGGLALIANNIGGSLTDLDNFTRGQGSLKPEVLQLLARELYDSNYDAERDLLVRPRPPAQVLCTAYPPPAAETKLDLS